jgi:hypothetical protein
VTCGTFREEGPRHSVGPGCCSSWLKPADRPRCRAAPGPADRAGTQLDGHGGPPDTARLATGGSAGADRKRRRSGRRRPGQRRPLGRRRAGGTTGGGGTSGAAAPRAAGDVGGGGTTGNRWNVQHRRRLGRGGTSGSGGATGTGGTSNTGGASAALGWRRDRRERWWHRRQRSSGRGQRVQRGYPVHQRGLRGRCVRQCLLPGQCEACKQRERERDVCRR